jgi:hypothetical protein
MRNIGSSTGIAIVSWLLVRQTQIGAENLISHISPFNPSVPAYLSEFAALGLDFRSPSTMARSRRYGNSTGTHLRLYGPAAPQLPPRRNPTLQLDTSG